MSSTTDIQNKWQQLKDSGLDLGAKQGVEVDAKYGGYYQVYQNGRIYWHPNTGAHEVHGGILTKYLSMGGHDVNPATGKRDLGFPKSDESWVIGESRRVSYFEWGAIYWVNNGRCVHGDLFNTYRQSGENNSGLGFPVSDNIKTSVWEIAYFECGCLFKTGDLPVVTFSFKPPLIGNPYFAGTNKGNLLEKSITITGGVSSENASDPLVTYFKNNVTFLSKLFSKKYCLKGVQSGDIVSLDITTTDCVYKSKTVQPTPIPSDPHGHPLPAKTIESVGMSANAIIPGDKQLKNRELYNLCFALDPSNVFVVSPHCVYAKDNWDNFGAVHITDSHVAKRYDGVKRELKNHPELDQAYPLFMNPNDNFRDFIKYANRMYRAGHIDVIMHTGDLVDYVFEKNNSQDWSIGLPSDLMKIIDDILTIAWQKVKNWFWGTNNNTILDDFDQSLRRLFEENKESLIGGGNFEWFIDLLMGRTKYADDAGSQTEELLVPILTTLGNHDYRPFAYDPAIEVEFKITDGDKTIVDYPYTNYQNTDWNLTRDEAKFLQKLLWGVDFNISPERALSYLIHYYYPPPYYTKKISRNNSFVQKLGSNRLIMIDTKYDAGIESLLNLIKGKAAIGSASEDVMSVFSGGDTYGFEPGEINMLKGVLDVSIDPGATGVIIVGIHAPAINPTGGEYNHYFRETEHPTIDPKLMRGYIKRNVDKNISTEALNNLTGDEAIKGWVVSTDLNFKRGDLGDNLDNGSPYLNREQFWEACTAKTGDRKVDLVLSGHIHKHTEWRIEWSEQRQFMRCYSDFYFENPSEYYSSTYPTISEKVHVSVVPGAAINGAVFINNRLNVPYPYHFVNIPPNQKTLNNAADPKAWWDSHKPVITQTACLGWMDYPQRQDPDAPGQNNFKPEPSFTGLRVITIQNNVISQVQFVSHDQIKSTNPFVIEVHDHRTAVVGIK